jgi:hypothetical protein
MSLKVLPKILTPVEWNAKKGIIAKMTTETGMGAALTKLNTAWVKVKWNVVDSDEGIRLQAGKTGRQTLAAYNLAEPLATAEFSKIAAVQTELRAVNKLAGELEIKWKASKVIPSSSRVYVGTIKTETLKLYNELARDHITTEWHAAKQRIIDKEVLLKKQALTVIKPYFASLRKFGAELKQKPTVDGYGALNTKQGFHQNVRGLNAALDRSMEPAWITWKDVHWKPLAQAGYPPRKDEEVVAKVDHVLDVLDQLERIVG